MEGTQITQRLINKVAVLDIENAFARAVVSLHGGQVLSFQPHGEEKVLWLSPDAVYGEGKAIRGGIPICWPWFSKRAEGGPNHGFARTNSWRLKEQSTLEGGETRLLLSLPETTHAAWNGSASLATEIVIGKELKVSLIMQNIGDTLVAISQALHTYFNVSNVEDITVEGLAGRRYLDEADNQKAYVQEGDVTLKGEVDRAYLNTSDTCTIIDPGLQRKIVIRKSGSNGTIVWNPGAELAQQMADVPDEGYRSMVCVETATLPALAVQLEPGQSHTMSMNISVVR